MEADENLRIFKTVSDPSPSNETTPLLDTIKQQPTTPMSQKRANQDHDYLPTPRKRIRHVNDTIIETDNIYKETVTTLKNIETKVEQGLANIKNTLDKHLSNIYLALLGKK